MYIYTCRHTNIDMSHLSVHSWPLLYRCGARLQTIYTSDKSE